MKFEFEEEVQALLDLRIDYILCSKFIEDSFEKLATNTERYQPITVKIIGYYPRNQGADLYLVLLPPEVVTKNYWILDRTEEMTNYQCSEQYFGSKVWLIDEGCLQKSGSDLNHASI